ncbi:quinon protein alcohol dehydrogenase-like superfamily [Pilobolus umbonatus]|nr:quinon protein alcohol dehydrogenase-like superfamily [Pilobolus umbonatus]
MTSGKRDRHLIYSNREKVRQRVSSVVMDGERVLWGHESGSITLCIRKKSNGNPHNKFKVFSGFHLGPVTLLSFPKLVSDVVVSGGVDRTIKIWDITTTLSVWTLLGPALPTSLEVTPDHRIIVGCEDGTISVWNDINLGQLAQFHRDNSSSSNYDILKRRLSSEIESKKLIIPPFNESDRHQVKSMIYDTQKCVIIVTYTGSTMIKKYAVESGQCLATYVLGHAHANEITSIKWDISPVNTIGSLESILKFRRTQNKRGNIIDLTLGKTADSDSSTGHALSKATRLLVSGDDFGRICVWNGDHDGITKPIRILDGHAASISALFVDKFKIVSGSDDGWIHVWEPLSGRNILTFSNKIPKNAPINRDDVNMTRVTNIDCSEYQGVVTIGNMIKIWDFSPGKEFTSKSKNKGKPAMNSRDRYKSVIHREVEESIKKIRAERIEEIQNDEAIKKMSLGGLSDEEMLEYALMLSTDHEDSYPSSDPFDSADYIEDSDDELMKAVIASLELEVHDPTVNFE